MDMTDAIKYAVVAAVGAGIGYFVARQQMSDQYFKLLAHETDEARAHYKKWYEEKLAVNAEEALEKYYPPLDELPEAIEEKPEPVVKPKPPQVPLDLPAADEGGKVAYHRIATPRKSEEQVEETAAPEAPEAEAESDDGVYTVITENDFIENETNYKQFSFTYYASDDVLANQSDEPVEESARVMILGKNVLEKLKAGIEAMDGFDRIYVRNSRGEWEFEVLRSPGAYMAEVHNKTG